MTRRVAVVDSSIAGYADLINSLPSDVDIVVIDASTGNGWQQLAEKIGGYSDIESLHIFSHGAEGSVQLGGETLNSATLSSYAQTLADIGSHMAADGDILLYGCSVGAGSLGSQFVSQFAAATGADVAASDDLTGTAALGGDWVLEVNAGAVQTQAIEASLSDVLSGPSLLTNGSFEAVDIASGSYGYLALGTSGGWSIDTANNVVLQDAASGWGFPVSPSGSQTMVLQSGGGPASISQQFAVTDATAYQVQLYLAGRPGTSFGANNVTVSVDGVAIGTVSAATIGTSGWGLYTLNMTSPLAAGTHTLSISGADTLGADHATAIDGVVLRAINASPVISSNGAGASASVSVAENATAVTTVTASDAEGATLAYSIVGGADAAKFAINGSTGALSFVTAPNYEAPTDSGTNNVYDVTVRVSDGVNVDDQAIAVTVTNVNEAPTLGGGAAVANQIQAATSIGLSTSNTSALRGLASDGQYLYVNDGGAQIDVYTTAGAYVGTHAVSGLESDHSQITFASGYLYAHNGSSVYRISTQDWSSSVVSVQADKPLLSTKYWVYDDLFSLPDGRVATIGADNGVTSTLRFYTVSADGKTFTWSEDRTLKTAGQPADNHGTASDGTYVYIVESQTQTYRAYSLATGDLAFTGAANALLSVGSGTALNNCTFITHDHVNGVFYVGGYNNAAILKSAAIAPANGYLSGATEDTPFTITHTQLAAALNEADVDSAALSFRIEGVLNGTLTKNGVAVTGGSTIVSAGDSLVWTPVANANGSIDAFTVRAWDGALASTQAGVVNIQVAAVNDAPVADASGTLAYTENQAATAVASALALSDVDSSSLTGATVQISGNYQSGADVLAFVAQNGITGSWNAATGTLTLTGTATVANYQAALRSITYVNSSDNPSAADRTVSFQVSDGALSSALATHTVTVAAVNDAPALTAAKATLSSGTEDTAFTVSKSQLLQGWTDVDGNTLSISAPTADHGTVVVNGDGSVTVTPAANYNGAITLSYGVFDGVATVPTSLSTTLAAVNDAPVIAAGQAFVVTENAANGAVVGSVSMTDVDAATSTNTFSITGGNANGAFAINAATGQITVADGSKLNYEGATSQALTVQVSDGVNAATSQTVTVNLTDVNEAPTAVTLTAVQSTIAENSAVAGGVKVATIAVTDDALGSKTLGLTGADAAQFEIRNGNELWFKGTSPDYEAQSSYQVAVTADDPTLGAAGSVEATSATFMLAVTNVNDAPALTGSPASLAAGTEDTGYTVTAAQLLQGWSDGDGNALAIVGNAVTADHGSVTYDATTQTYTVTPAANYNGAVTLSYGVSDGTLTTAASLNLNLVAVNDAPTAGVAYGGGYTVTQLLQPAGSAPVSASVVDMNGDGRADIVVGFENHLTAAVLSGNTAGGFDAAQTYRVNSTPMGVAVGDVNGDGRPDIVTADLWGNTATVLTAQSGGGYAAASYWAAASVPWGIALGDVNGDGKLDIVTADAGSYGVSVLTNRGDGSFNTGQFLPVYGVDPHSVALGDLNGDGRADIVTANTGSGTVSVLTTNASGGFNAAQTYAVDGLLPTQVVLADVNGDGRLDIVTSDAGSGRVSVLQGQAGGTFAAAQTYAIAGFSPADVQVGDMNGDGRADIVTIDYDSGQVAVLNGQAGGGFAPAQIYAAGPHANFVTLGDVNGDGQLDIVVTDRDDNRIVVLTRNAGVVSAEDTAYTVTAAQLLQGWSDVDGNVLSVAGHTVTADHGTVSYDAATQAYTITPDANYNGAITLSYGVTDGQTTVATTLNTTITAVNDAPAIAAGQTFAVAENAANGAVVGSVVVTDVDAVNPANTFSITGGNANGAFAINAATGQITVADGSKLNYEGATSQALTVQVSDGVNAATSQTVTVNLTDVNEAPTAVTLTAVQSTIAENSAVAGGVKVATIAVTDDALGSETLGLTGADAAQFEIRNGNELWFTGSSPDYEAKSSYQVAVTADDETLGAAGSVEATSATFTLAVTNVNEAPVITSSGGAATASVSVVENGTAVTTVTATDVDSGTLTYSIAGGADAAKFSINASTGALSFATAPNYEAPTDSGADNVYDVTVRVSDGQLTDDQAIAVTVTNVNDNAPVVSAGQTFAVAENAANGAVVGSVAVTDADAAAVNPANTFSITGGNANGAFAINAATGQITVADGSKLNYEGATSQALTVQVSDGTINPGHAGFDIEVAYATAGVTINSFADADALLAGTNRASTVLATAPYIDYGPASFDHFTNNLPFPGPGGDDFALKATTSVTIPTSGTWTFGKLSDDGFRLKIDGQVVWEHIGGGDTFKQLDLTAGVHSLEMDFYERGGGENVVLYAQAGTHTSFNTGFKLVGDTANGGLAASTSTVNASTQTVTVQLVDVNEAPSAVTLTAVQSTIAENTAVAGGVKVATIAVTDDALGSETLGLTGADAAQFEIRNGSELWFTGTSPDYEAKSSYKVAVTADDPTLGAAGSVEATSATFTLAVTNVNEAPVADASGTLAYTENQAATAVASALTLSDVDSSSLTGATVQISGGYQSGADVLAFATQNGITGSWNAATGILSLTGSATVANYQAALRSITYANSSDNPNTADRTVSFQVNDGLTLSAPSTHTVAVAAVNDAPTMTLSGIGGGSTLIYQVDNPIFSNNAPVYTIDASAANAGLSFDRVHYRMQTTGDDGKLYYADVSFDAWSGLTVSQLAVPTGANNIFIQRNVTNLTVDSNYATVTNGSGFTGRLEFWSGNYGTGVPGGLTGNGGNYDYGDTGSTGVGYGSFQIHNLSGTPQTVFAWNDQRLQDAQYGGADIGFGNNPNGNPDWTFAGSTGAYNPYFNSANFQLQIWAESSSTITEDTVSNLKFTGTPFADTDSGTLTVTLGVAEGTITGNAGTGITVGGDGSSRTFTGTVPDLNAYFTTAGKITYTPVADANGVRQLAVAVSDGVATTSQTINFSINAVNDAPVLTGVQTAMTAGTEDTAYTITQAKLLEGWTDVDTGSTLSVSSLSATNGTLVNNGNGTWTFTPSANYNGTVSLSYSVSDGTTTVATSRNFSLAAVNDAPTLGGGSPSATLVEAGGVANGSAGTATATVTLTKADVDGTTPSYDSAWLVANGWSTADGGATYSHAGTYGVATLATSTGVVSYALDNSLSATQALTAGQAVTDPFTVQVTDGALTASKGISFSITGSNDAPALTGTQTAMTAGTEDTAYTFTQAKLLEGWADVDAGSTLSVTGLSATNGTLVNNGNGTWSFTPSANYNGTVNLSYSVSDGSTTVAATRSFTLDAVNDAPTLGGAAVANQIQSATSIGLSTGGNTSALRGLASDGQYLYVNDGGSQIDVYTTAGAYVGTHSVVGLESDHSQITFASGYLYAHNGSSVYRISTQDWSSSVVSVPADKPLLSGKYWVYDDLFSLPDGRVATISADNGVTSTLRFYTVSADGKTFTWSEDRTLKTAGQPADNHGTASDGTYVYIVDSQTQSYRAYSLATGDLAFTGVSNALQVVGSGTAPSNSTFITHDHVNGVFYVGGHSNAAVLKSAAIAPANGILSGATEDTPFTITHTQLAAALNEADVDNAALSFRIEGVLNGTLTKNGVAVTGGSTIVSAGDSLVWTPVANANGSIDAFTVRAWDGALASTQAGVVNIQVAAVNDAPTADASGTLAYTENQAATAVASALTVGDIEGTLAGATVQISGNYQSGADVLAFAAQNGITGSWNAATGTLTLTGTATVANYQTALRSITYANSSDNPSTADRTVSFQVSDGALTSPLTTHTVTVTAVNDAPTLGGSSPSNGLVEAGGLANGSAGTATATLTLTKADVDGTTPSYDNAWLTTHGWSTTDGGATYSCTGSYGVATLATSTGVVTYALDNSRFATQSLKTGQIVYDPFTVQVTDGTLTASKPFNFSIVGTNDTPVLLDTTDPAPVLEAADASAQNIAAISGSFALSDADLNNLLTASVVGSPVVMLNGVVIGSGYPSALTAAGAFTLSPTVQSSTGGTMAVGWTYDPAAANLDFLKATDTLTVTYQVKVNDGTADTAVQDVTIRIGGTNDAPVLTATSSNPTFTEGAGHSQGSAVTPFSAVAASTVEVGELFTALSFTVNGVADGAAEVIGLDGSHIALTDGASGATAHGVQYAVSLAGAVATVALTFPAGLNAADLQSAIQGITYQNERVDTPTAGDRVFTLTRVSDNGGGVNTTVLTSASTVHVAAVNDAPELGQALADQQAVGNTPFSYALPAGTFTDVDSAHLTLTATLADGTALPSWLHFDAATASFTGTPPRMIADVFTVRVTASDGSLSVSDDFVLTAVKGNAVPTAADATLSLTEDVAYTLGAADFHYADEDAEDSLYQVVITSVPASGSLRLDGVAVGAGQRVDVADILAGKLVYQPAANANGADVAHIGYRVSDGMEDSAASYTLTVNLAPVNDVPVLGGAASGDHAVKEDVDASASGQLTIADIDSGESHFQAASGAGANGYGSFSLAADGQWSYSLNSSLAAIQQLGEGATLTDRFTAVSADGSASQVISLTITGTNDAPLLSGSATVLGAGTQEAAYTVTKAQLLAGWSDVDAGDSLSVVNLVADHGRVVANADGSYTITGADGYTGAMHLSYSVSDGRATVGAGLDYSLVTNWVTTASTTTLVEPMKNLQLTGSAAVNGVGNALDNQLLGNAGANQLSGGAGNDTLVGGAGADTLMGGTGNDTYDIDQSGDVIVEAAGAGTDSVISSISYVLSANLENLSLTGSANLNGTGNAADNVLIGNDGNNVLSGAAGNDNLVGGAGNDTLLGGTGADSLDGGSGNDLYDVDNAGDVVVEAAGGGTDSVQSSVSYSLTANVENLTLTGSAAINGTGNELANQLIGNGAANVLSAGAGNDTISGGAGNDTMIGGTGDDLYVVSDSGDVIVEAAGAGVDSVQASVSYSLSANVENLTLSGSAAINATGNDLGNVLLGNSGANVLFGGLGNDTLTGGAGNDTLIGGLGADSLVGGSGNDTFVFDSLPTNVTNVDRISDFTVGVDQLQFDGGVFTGFGVHQAALSAEMFRSGAGVTTAADADDHLIFNTTTGQLFYDVDGVGGQAAVQVATLTANLALSAADIYIG